MLNNRYLLLLFVLLISSCTPKSDVKNIDTFDFGEECLHGCWLGINPGITTSEEALDILQKTNQIDQRRLKVLDNGVQAVWSTKNPKYITAPTYIEFENNLVKSVLISNIYDFTLRDFINVLGEPDKIAIKVHEAPHGELEVMYSIYYQSRNIATSALGSWDGPNPNNPLYGVFLNVNAEFLKEDVQPWLGYGNLENYLPAQELPKEPNQ